MAVRTRQLGVCERDVPHSLKDAKRLKVGGLARRELAAADHHQPFASVAAGARKRPGEYREVLVCASVADEQNVAIRQRWEPVRLTSKAFADAVGDDHDG